MSGHSRVRALWPVLLAVGTAETARRLLAPRAPALEPVRVDVQSYFSAEEIDRGRRYARPQLALGLTRGLIDAMALARLVRRPPRPLQRAGPGGQGPIGGAVTAAGLSLALSLPTLPLRAISRRRAMAVGLDTQSWGAWAGDAAKAAVIQTVFAGGAGAAVVAVTRRFPRLWWVPLGSGAVVFGAGLAALAPVVLDPIFNDFEPLPEGELRSDVLELARAADVSVGEVYSVDASRRTTAANAYVTGLGPTKRVVLFDTLIDRYQRDEIRLVVAHELAHVRHRDLWRGLLYAAIVAPAAALAVQRLSWELSPERGTPAALPAIALAASVITGPIGLVGNRLSRAMERRADHFALELAGAPDAFVSFERTIALQNVADLDPPRWVSRLMATHPPTAERIGAAVAFAQAE
ncbi:MAG TPA: M48 family metalloprotease [Solirubrobacteraceae bacterium]|nr:M48 family metalloprotease [Solirubrobacteraceae bacterium]